MFKAYFETAESNLMMNIRGKPIKAVAYRKYKNNKEGFVNW